MSRLSINFATEQRSLTAWSPALGFSLLLAGVLALGVAAWDYRQHEDEKANLQSRRDGLHQRTQRLYAGDPVPAEMAAQVEQANTAYALIRTPWEEIFMALEAARDKEPGDIALLSVKADAAKRELILTGEAKDFTALSAFTSALSAIPIFQNITLANDKLSSGNPPIVVAFDLRLAWRAKSVSPR